MVSWPGGCSHRVYSLADHAIAHELTVESALMYQNLKTITCIRPESHEAHGNSADSARMLNGIVPVSPQAAGTTGSLNRVEVIGTTVSTC